LQTVRHRFNIYASSLCFLGAMTWRWVLSTHYTLRCNTASIRFGLLKFLY